MARRHLAMRAFVIAALGTLLVTPCALLGCNRTPTERPEQLSVEQLAPGPQEEPVASTQSKGDLPGAAMSDDETQAQFDKQYERYEALIAP